jgi:ParB family chromosome partitioning protein
VKRKALGRGLSALLPEPEPQAGAAALEVPLDRLRPNHQQPRQAFPPERLAELAASIRQSGVIQPILVRRVGDAYEIVAGERRWRAAGEAGLERVPVVVRDVPDDRLLELALVENIQREELTPIEEAEAFRVLQRDHKLSQEEIAARVGRDRTTVANALRLLRLPRPVRDLLDAGRIQAGHGRALLGLADDVEREALAREVAAKGLSVREVERRVAAAARPPSAKPVRDPNTRAAEEKLRAALGARVEIRRRGRRGTLQIAFDSEAELNRLYEWLLRGSKSRRGGA